MDKLNLVENFNNFILPWLMTNGIKILGILIAAYVVHKITKVSLERIIRKTVISDHFLSKEAEKKREDTLIRIFHRALHVVVILVAVLMVVSELGVDITPLLAGAGIIGLAFGFGAQYLIRDLITGFFIILENQYRVGDVVCFDGTCGLVEDINLRTTILRDLDGKAHHIPHGEIKKVSNLSKDFARVNLNIGISYDSSAEKAIEILNRLGREMAEEEKWKEDFNKPIEVLGIDDFADSSVIIKVLGETKPLRQWDAAREYRKRVKIAFDREGIEIPYPHRTIIQKSS